MKVVRMNGGLGNQMFQYIFMRYLEHMTGEELIIDDVDFFLPNTGLKTHDNHQVYSLDRIFGIKAKRLSEFYDRDVFTYIVDHALTPAAPGENPRGILDIFKESGMDYFPVQEGTLYEKRFHKLTNCYSTPINDYDPSIHNFQGNIYYYGYWINVKYFAHFSGNFLREFVFPELPDDKNREYMKKIKEADENSVALHVRRGDFVTLGWAIDNSVYRAMMEDMRKEIPHPEFFVFSDDIEWVKENAAEVGLLPTDGITYVEGNDAFHGYIDMQLMKECRGMIYSSSSFSYLASILNTRKDKIVLQPTARQVLYY